MPREEDDLSSRRTKGCTMGLHSLDELLRLDALPPLASAPAGKVLDTSSEGDLPPLPSPGDSLPSLEVALSAPSPLPSSLADGGASSKAMLPLDTYEGPQVDPLPRSLELFLGMVSFEGVPQDPRPEPSYLSAPRRQVVLIPEEGASPGGTLSSALPSVLPSSVIAPSPTAQEVRRRSALETSAAKVKKERRWVGPFIAILVVILVAGLGYFGFQVSTVNDPEAKKQEAATALYRGGGAGVADRVECPAWKVIDDGTTKTFTCPQKPAFQGVVSQGQLDDALVWNPVAQKLKQGAWVVTDHRSWGFMAPTREALAPLAQAKHLPICELRPRVGLFCPAT